MTRDPGVGVDGGLGVAVGVGRSVGRGVVRGAGFGVGLGVGRGVGLGVGFEVGSGLGVGLIVTVPADSASANLSLLSADSFTGWEPTGSRPLQRNVTPRFQSVPPTRAIACAVPPIVTRTQFAGDPSRLRYETVTTTDVVGYPLVGETDASNSFVGPAAAHAGTAADKTSTSAASEATNRACRPQPIKDRYPVPR